LLSYTTVRPELTYSPITFVLSYSRCKQHMVSFFFSSRRRHTRSKRDWSSDVCSSDLWSGDAVVQHPTTLAQPAVHQLEELLVLAAPHVLEHADRRDGVEAGLGDVAVVHQPDLRELLQALLADLLIPPRDLLFRQRHADGLHPTGGGVAHHPAPAAADVQQAVALGKPQLVEDQAVLILLRPVERLLRGRALRPHTLIPTLRGIRLISRVVGAGIGHGVAEEELVEVIAHVVVALHDLLIPLPGVPG